MKRVLPLLVLSVSWACGDDEPTGPYDGIPVGTTVTAPGLSAPVDVVRDSFGIPHIHAATEADAAFANGYMQAADRIAEMDLLRHFAEGRVGELFGALQPSQIDNDLTMRMHRFRHFAELSLAQLMASSDPVDQAVVASLARYADGVNQYVSEVVAGRYTLDPEVTVFFDATRFDPWTPVNSLAIGYLQQWSLQYDESELSRQEFVDTARATFDQATNADRLRRAKAGIDLRSLLPMDPSSTIAGFPNVESDTGTRAKRAPGDARVRPTVPVELLAAGQRALNPATDLFRKIKNPKNGSNNWVVGPSLAGGKTILANDPHLQLINPPVWHLLHITVPDKLDVTGVSFPGIPGVILGHNAHVAWGATVVSHDANDFYLETIAPCGGGQCVQFKGEQVPLETFTETIKIGALGTIVEERQVTYELVPHHGPILPIVANNNIVPRTAPQAISSKYTGYAPSSAVRALYRLNHAASRAEAFEALDDFQFGGQNWVIVDDAGSFGWTSTNQVPLRSAGCHTFDPIDNPTGLAPFFVIPGDGSCEWEGFMDARYIPHAIDPAQGFLASANQDPVGETFDGDPLNGPVVDGRPLYAGWNYDPGLRQGTIARRLQALAARDGAVTADDLASIQGDSHSSLGELLRPAIAAAIAKLDAEIATPGTHPDLAAFVAGLPAAKRTRLRDAGARLAAWSLETPPAVEGSPTAAELSDSAATTIFNFWAVRFMVVAFSDEEAAMGFSADVDRAAVLVLARPNQLASQIAPETGESILCDDLRTPAALESCTLDVLVALDQAMEQIEGRFGTDRTAWRWGKLHTLTLAPLTPSTALEIPAPDDPDPALRGGFPRPGDNYAVDACHPGTRDTDFTYDHGPSMRHITQFDGPGQPRTRMSLPGGQVFDRSSPHYRELMETWRRNEYFDMPFAIPDIIVAAENRTRFEAP